MKNILEQLATLSTLDPAEWLTEIRRLNQNLETLTSLLTDFRTIGADLLGYRVLNNAPPQPEYQPTHDED